MINEEHGQQKTTVVLQAFVPSVLQHTREGLKKNIFFLRKCFEILNILQKCFSGLSAAGLHPSAGPARPGPEPTNSAPSWGQKSVGVFEHIPWGRWHLATPPVSCVGRSCATEALPVRSVWLCAISAGRIGGRALVPHTAGCELCFFGVTI